MSASSLDAGAAVGGEDGGAHDGGPLGGEDATVRPSEPEVVVAGGTYGHAITVDSTGAPHVVFAPRSMSGVRHAVRDDSGWHASTIVDTGEPRDIRLVAGMGGVVHVAWVEDFELFYAHTSTGRWLIERPVPRGVVSVDLAVGRNDDQPRLAYQHQRFDGGFTADELHFAERTSSGAWSTVLVHAESYDVGWQASIAIDPFDTVAIVYCQDLCGTGVNIAVKERGMGWQLGMLPDTIRHSGTTLFIDSRARPGLTWMDHIEDRVMFAYLSDGEWVPTLLDPDYPNVGGSIRLMEGAEGNTHALYGTNPLRQATLVGGVGEWQRSTIPLGETDGLVEAAVGPDDAVHVLFEWEESTPERFVEEMRYQRFAP